MQQTKQPISGIIYEGPSIIDGSPIVCIAVFPNGKANSKTGAVLQTYILYAGDTKPSTANKLGLDFAICGDCVHKGTPTNDPQKKAARGRTCYVQFTGPNAVHAKYKRGGYTHQAPELMGLQRFVRLGTYGDPLALPENVLNALLAGSLGHTGYTHQSNRFPKHNGLELCMTSADNQDQAKEAHTKGHRTFRVIPLHDWITKGKDSLLPNEILCPASNEAGRNITCIQCKLCNGSTYNTGKSIAIPAHGVSKNHYKG